MTQPEAPPHDDAIVTPADIVLPFCMELYETQMGEQKGIGVKTSHPPDMMPLGIYYPGEHFGQQTLFMLDALHALVGHYDTEQKNNEPDHIWLLREVAHKLTKQAKALHELVGRTVDGDPDIHPTPEQGT